MLGLVEVVEAAFIVPLLPVPRTGWRLLYHYYGLDIALLVRKQIGLLTAQKVNRIHPHSLRLSSLLSHGLR